MKNIFQRYIFAVSPWDQNPGTYEWMRSPENLPPHSSHSKTLKKAQEAKAKARSAQRQGEFLVEAAARKNNLEWPKTDNKPDKNGNFKTTASNPIQPEKTITQQLAAEQDVVANTAKQKHDLDTGIIAKIVPAPAENEEMPDPAKKQFEVTTTGIENQRTAARETAEKEFREARATLAGEVFSTLGKIFEKTNQFISQAGGAKKTTEYNPNKSAIAST